MPSKVWDEVNYPFQNFNGCTVEICKRKSNFITTLQWMQLPIHVVIKVNPCDLSGPWPTEYPQRAIMQWHGFCVIKVNKHVVTINSLGPNATIWRHRSGSTLAQLMACCLPAPSHYLNQCWPFISKVLWHSSQGNFVRDTSITNQ